MWNPEWGEHTAGAGQAKEQRSRSARRSGVRGHRAGQEERGSRRMGEGFQVSGQGEGSQHTGIAEIMSSEAGFVPQLFFNSEREEPENKESGKWEAPASVSEAPGLQTHHTSCVCVLAPAWSSPGFPM